MRNSLRTQLTLAFISLAILPLAIVGFVTIQRTLTVEREQAIVLQEQVAQRVAAEVEAFIAARENELRLLIDVQGLAQLDAAQQRALLSSLANNEDLNEKIYAEIVLVDSAGQETIFVSPTRVTTAAGLENRAGNPEFEIPKSTEDAYYSSVKVDPASGEPVMTISLPLTDLQTGAFLGVLAADFRFNPIWDLMANADVIGSGFVYMIDNNNRVVAHPNSSVVLRGTTTELAAGNSFTSGLGGDNVVQAQSEISFGQSDTLAPQEFTIVAEQPAAEALALANQSIITSGVALLISAILAGGLGGIAALNITRPIQEMATTAQTISAGDLSQNVAVTRQDEIGTLGDAFNSMTAQLRDMVGGLEQRVSARTRDLDLATTIGREVSRVRDLESLLPQAARLIQKQFDLYQTQIYLVDKTASSLILQASIGHVGSKLLEQGHTLPINRQSLNGLAVIEKRAVIVADTAVNPMFRPHPLLPNTKSEMVVPLLAESEVVGVLDLQSSRLDSLSEENLPAFEVLAGQLAVAIQNARLFSEREKAAAELRESEERFALAVAGSNDGIWDWDIAANKFYLSPRWKEMLGYEEHELANEFATFERRLHPDDHTMVMQAMENYIGGHTYEDGVELRMQHRDGSYRWMLLQAIAVRDDEGNPLRMAGSQTDITTRKESEVALQKAQARTEEILESINVPLVISKVSDGTVAYVNEPMATVIRESREALIGWVTPDFYQNPADRQDYLTALRQKGRVSNYEIPLKRKDGELFWALVSGQVISFEGEAAIITSLIDVTERREAQAAVIRRAAELQTVADVSGTAATSLDEEKLLQSIVDLTKERFHLYHAHIYLLDNAKENLVLAAGAGEIGQQMVAETRTIPMQQERSLVARAARTRRGVIINDVQAESGFLPHPLLPDTRAEMAVPIIAGDRLLGVLDVQANETNHFTEQDVQIQSTLAAQTAVALQNARQYRATNAALEEASTFRQLVANSGQAIGISDLEGHAIYGNPAMLQLLGGEEADDAPPSPGLSIFSYYPEEIQTRFAAEIIPTVMEQGQWQGELRLATARGEVPTYESYFLLRDEEGNPFRIASIITDMSSQKEAEAVMAANQAQLQQAMRAARLANWQFDVPTQTFTLNDQAYELLGTSAAAEGGYNKVLPAFMGQFVHRADQEMVTETVRNLLGNPAMQSVDKEVRMTCGDGALKTMLLRFEVGQMAGEQVRQLLGTVQDITPQKEAERQQAKLARELEERLEQVNALQRAMTREGWQAFLTAEERAVQGFMFGGEALQPVPSGEHLSRYMGDALDFDRVEDVTFDAQKTAVAMPLNLYGETIGVIGARNESGEPLTADQQALLAALSAQVAEALERARLFEETELGRQQLDAQAQQLTVINDVAETVAQELNPIQVLEIVYERVRQVIPADAFIVGLYDSDKKMVNYPMVYDQGQRFDEPAKPPLPGSFMKQVLDTGEPVLANFEPEEISAESEEEVALLGSPVRPHGVMFVPLHSGTTVNGAISLQNYRGYHYTEDDLQLLSGIANHVTVALENARLFTQTEQALAETELLYRIGARLNEAENPAELVTAVTESLADRHGIFGALLLQFDLNEDGRPIRAEVAASSETMSNILPNQKLDLSHFPMPQLWLNNPDTPILISDVTNDARVDEATKTRFGRMGVQSTALLPLRLGTSWVGLLLLNWSETAVSFTEEDERLFGSIAPQFATAVNSLALLAETQARAQHEQTLRAISTEIGGTVDAETVLRAAVRSVGRALGLETYIYLDQPETTEEPITPANGNHETVTEVLHEGTG